MESTNDAKKVQKSIYKHAQEQLRHQWAAEVYIEELDEERDKQLTSQQESLVMQYEAQLQGHEQAIVDDYTQDLQRLEEQISALTLSHSETVERLKQEHHESLTEAKRVHQYDVAERQKRIYDLKGRVEDMDKLLIGRDLSQEDMRERLTRNITKDAEEITEWGFLYRENEYSTYLYTVEEECEAEIQDMKDAAAKELRDSHQEVDDLRDEMLEMKHWHNDQLEDLDLVHGQDLVHQCEKCTALDLQTTAKQHEIEQQMVALKTQARSLSSSNRKVLQGPLQRGFERH